MYVGICVYIYFLFPEYVYKINGNSNRNTPNTNHLLHDFLNLYFNLVVLYFEF